MQIDSFTETKKSEREAAPSNEIWRQAEGEGLGDKTDVWLTVVVRKGSEMKPKHRIFYCISRSGGFYNQWEHMHVYMIEILQHE